MTETKQPTDHTPRDIVGKLAHMPFQKLCQEIVVLPDDEDALEKLRATASDDERALIDLLIALKGARLVDVAPLFATADDDPAKAKIAQSDVADTMLSLLTALRATTGVNETAR